MVTTHQPLRGVRVLDFTQVMAGPYCTRLLAELGAEVIKIEPVDGEVVRHRPPSEGGRSRYFGHLNAGKRSVALDLRDPAVVDGVRAMISQVDVVVENFRPGVMSRLGLSADVCRSLNPSVVFCSITGYGQHGSDAQRPAVAPVIHAATGFDHALQAYLGLERPPATGIFVADVVAGALAVGGITAAVLDARQSGNGATLDISLADAALSVLVHELQAAQTPDPLPSPSYEAVATSDGFLMVAVLSDRHLAGLASAIERPELIADDRFARSGDRRFHTTELREITEEWTRSRTMESAEARLTAEGVPCGRYRTVGDQLVDPHLLQRGSLAQARDGSGTFTVSTSPLKFLDDSGRTHTGRPESLFVQDLGQDTRSVLQRLAGMDDAHIDALVEAGSVVITDQQKG